MTHAIIRLTLVSLLATGSSDAVVPITNTTKCSEYQDDYVLVRKDVVEELNSDRKKLPICEESLENAQVTITTAVSDVKALQQAAIDQQAVIAQLKAQMKVLEKHISTLEANAHPEKSVADQLMQSWEQIDGTAGVTLGYALGTATCLGMAYAFNSDALNR